MATNVTGFNIGGDKHQIDYESLVNKPIIPAEQVQSDWNETDENSKAFIQNKPESLKNPHTLTFEGGATGTYDGSSDTVINIPKSSEKESLKNPYPLVIKGAAEATYDGSEQVEVTIPEGGSGTGEQSDWNVTDETSDAFIKNKPFHPEIWKETPYKDYKLTNPSTCGDTVDGTEAIEYLLTGVPTFRNGTDTSTIYPDKIKVILDGSEHIFQKQEQQEPSEAYYGVGDWYDVNSYYGLYRKDDNGHVTWRNSDKIGVLLVQNGEYSCRVGRVRIVLDKSATSEEVSAMTNTISVYDFDASKKLSPEYYEQADWNETDENSGGFIKNKPVISAGTGEKSVRIGEGPAPTGRYAIATGYGSTSSGDYSYTGGEGGITASGKASWGYGGGNTASGNYSHAEGAGSKATGNTSHAEGSGTVASGDYSHAEGNGSAAYGNYSHAEGTGITGIAKSNSAGSYAHAEGSSTTASGQGSHAEGNGSTASGYASHAEGSNTTAYGDYSHAEGNGSKASSNNQHVSGKYNIEDTANTYAEIIGNGTSNSDRSNARTLDWNGNEWLAGSLTADGGIILSSSTEGSTKKFKITVDDTGALTSTEVPA